MYEPDKPRMMEVTDPNRGLFSCMRGEHGVGCYVPGGSAVTLPTLIVIGFLSIILSRFAATRQRVADLQALIQEHEG